MADALAAADVTGWINPLFSLVDIADTFSFDSASDADSNIAMVDPVDGRKILSSVLTSAVTSSVLTD